MTRRKYLSEFAINMCATHTVLLQHDDLARLHERIPTDIPPFHIYFIGRRPRISVDSDCFKFTPSTVKGRLVVHQGPTQVPIDFECPNHPTRPIVALKSDWPHNTLQLIGADGNVAYSGKTAVFAPFFTRKVEEHLDLEVMYVGQSFGDDGERVAATRLQSHSTLQQILAEASRLSPDKEIWLVLASFEPWLLASFDGRRATQTETTMDEDDAHMKRVYETPISEGQQINFTEAAFIRYFEPAYNDHFKTNFPNPAHKTYRECYDIDLNSVFVEIDTEPLRCRFYSQAVDRRWNHLPQFALHDSSERAAMLDVLLPGAKR